MSREAFLYAHEVLTWLDSLGLFAAAELYHDGSGSLMIHREELNKVSPGTRTEIEERLHSTRWDTNDGFVYTLSSCQGWHP